MNQSFVQPTLQPIEPHDPAYGHLLSLAKAPAEHDLGKTVDIDADRLDRLGHWAFLLGQLCDVGDDRIDYSDTPYAETASEGGRSNVYAALFKQHDDDWSIVAHATGPTDVAWLSWPEEHGAPGALFGF